MSITRKPTKLSKRVVGVRLSKSLAAFVGLVRPSAGEAAVECLELQQYEKFTRSTVESIAADGRERFELLGLTIIHRFGSLLPGEPIVFVATAAAHRRAALQAVDYLMDRLKTEAPFWKREHRPCGLTLDRAALGRLRRPRPVDLETRPHHMSKSRGEPRWDGTKLSTQWMRAIDALKRAKTNLLIIDEMDRASRRPTLSIAIAGSLRDLADQGICAIAFLCTDLSSNLFRNCRDLNERLDAPVIIEPLDLLLKEDARIFADLVSGFDQAMVDAAILPRLSGLSESETTALLGEACNGILRQLARIIETAMIAVIRRNGHSITHDDLANAVDEWSIAKGFLDYNPFRPES